MKVKFNLKSSGRSPVEEFIQKCSASIRGDFLDAILKLTEGENLQMPLSRNLSNLSKGLHELRLKDSSGQIRVFYFVKKKEGVYLLHAFKKKSQELPNKEIDLVLKRIKEI